MIRRRIVNAYLSSVVSISLVLLMIGIAAMLIGNARTVSDYLKENLKISVLLKEGETEEDAEDYITSISSLPYVNGTHLVSREEGTQELTKMLGEDFLSVFETSPVPVSVDVTLKPEYVSKDSLVFVTRVLGTSPLVDEVNCEDSLVEALDANLGRISLIFGVFIALLLFISFVLINNTVRLNVYSRRFTIHTMKLVGATRSFIRAPFVRDAVLQGLVASAIAAGALAAIMAAARNSFSQLFAIFDKWMLPAVMALMVVCGVLICVVSTYFVVNKLVAMTKDDLYF